jgi:hypothetical protein
MILDFVLPEAIKTSLCRECSFILEAAKALRFFSGFQLLTVFLVLWVRLYDTLRKTGLHFCVVIPKQGCFQIGTYSWISLSSIFSLVAYANVFGSCRFSIPFSVLVSTVLSTMSWTQFYLPMPIHHRSMLMSQTSSMLLSPMS